MSIGSRTNRQHIRKNEGVIGRKAGALFVVAWLSCLAPAAATPAEEDAGSATVSVQHSNFTVTGVRDDAAMMLVGAALIGLAAAVRRAG